MNFISEMEGQEIHVELKYCERCGGLWLRPQGAGGYIAPLAVRVWRQCRTLGSRRPGKLAAAKLACREPRFNRMIEMGTFRGRPGLTICRA